MERLSIELVALICSFSDIRSLKKIRLVNSKFTQAAARYLFEGLCVTLIPKYLDKVTEVASHPTLRFYVRTLYFDYDILDDFFTEYEIWRAEIDKGRSLTGEAEDDAMNQSRVLKSYFSQADLHQSHSDYCGLLASQKACFEGRMDLAMLSAAFAVLPNLRAIKTIESACCRGAARSTTYSAITGNENSWFPILSDVQRNTYLPQPFADPSVSTQPDLARPLATLISSLGLTRRQILTMEVGEIAWSFWEDTGPSGFSYDTQQFIYTAFRYLEELKIILEVDAYDLEFRLQGSLPLSITTFIKAAPRLRLLDLEFESYGMDDNEISWNDPNSLAAWFPYAGQLFATLTLPTLTSFCLRSCILTEEILVDFLTRHATTLKNVTMDTVVLDDQSTEPTSWEKTLKHIAPILSLDSVSLWTLQSDDIVSVILAGDPDAETRKARHQAYCQALADFLRRRSRTECPKILDFARPTG